jgi:hypothetical protein
MRAGLAVGLPVAGIHGIGRGCDVLPVLWAPNETAVLGYQILGFGLDNELGWWCQDPWHKDLSICGVPHPLAGR